MYPYADARGGLKCQTNRRRYTSPMGGGSFNIVQTSSPLLPPKANEVIVKIYTVLLQVCPDPGKSTDCHGLFPSPPNSIPCSDMAGEVVAIGENVVEAWRSRLCKFNPRSHTHGDLTPVMLVVASRSWAAFYGVLKEYEAFTCTQVSGDSFVGVGSLL
ncbi:hypothetical protein B0H19DRAFT_1074514 [Mycena capillaripes]|nr:hypothetical protein B0H19DRAFT_1074514 [Mycena capillaripes]